MRRLTAALLCALLLGGCSIKFAYNNLDRLIRWQASDYLDLDSGQRDYLQAEIESALVWHRKEHLPLYADFIETVPAQLSDGVTAATLATLFEQLLVWGAEVEAKAMPVMVHVLASLSDAQVARLAAKLEESNLELAEPELDGTAREFQDEWAQDMQDGLKRFIGRLSSEQAGYIAVRARGYTPERVLWAEYRRRWQSHLLALLEERRSAEFPDGFAALVRNQKSYYGPEYLLASESNLQLGREVLSHVLSNMTDKQHARFVETLEDLAGDLRELALGD